MYDYFYCFFLTESSSSKWMVVCTILAHATRLWNRDGRLVFDWVEHFLRVILSFCLNQLIFLDIIFFYKHLEYHSNFLDLITKAIFLWNEIVIMPFWIKFWPVHNHKCFSRQVESLPKKSITIYKNGWRRLKLLRTFVQTCLNAQVPSQ